MFDIKITESNNENTVLKLLKKLQKTNVLVGIPADESGRKEGGAVNNAELLYIHTHGSALKNIPARPVIEPAIEDDKEVIGDLLGEVFKSTLDGNESETMAALEKAGMHGQNISRDWFENSKNKWAKNSDVTIKGKGSDKPLIDTGELRKSITYVVEKG